MVALATPRSITSSAIFMKPIARIGHGPRTFAVKIVHQDQHWLCEKLRAHVLARRNPAIRRAKLRAYGSSAS